MPDKLIDNKIPKALECCVELFYENNVRCDQTIEGLADDVKSIFDDLINRQKSQTIKEQNKNSKLRNKINRLKAENSNLQEKNSNLTSDLTSLQKDLTSLQNAYKQCAWERDIFAEDMKEEIKKDCSYLMLDIKTIKAEAYKEFAERLHEELRIYETKDKFNKSVFLNVVDKAKKDLEGDNN